MYGFEYGLMFSVPITLVLLLGFGIIGRKQRYPIPYYVFVIVGIIYINYMISYAFFPIDFMEIPEYSIYNNIDIHIDFVKANKVHLLLNVILTVPLGIVMQFITNMKNLSRLLLVFMLSISIEILQLFILVVFKPIDVYFDIMDLICNGIGGIVGLGLIALVNFRYKNALYQNNNTILGYMINVCKNCANNNSSLIMLKTEM